MSARAPPESIFSQAVNGRNRPIDGEHRRPPRLRISKRWCLRSRVSSVQQSIGCRVRTESASHPPRDLLRGPSPGWPRCSAGRCSAAHQWSRFALGSGPPGGPLRSAADRAAPLGAAARSATEFQGLGQACFVWLCRPDPRVRNGSLVIRERDRSPRDGSPDSLRAERNRWGSCAAAARAELRAELRVGEGSRGPPAVPRAAGAGAAERSSSAGTGGQRSANIRRPPADLPGGATGPGRRVPQCEFLALDERRPIGRRPARLEL
jgi:hypothetical protein